MLNSFRGTAQDLQDAISYEVHALDYLRERLFMQSEAVGSRTTVTLGDVADNGLLKARTSVHIHEDLCQGAVLAALGRLRPLAFAAAFKMQDMLVEWILRANGHKGWRFHHKIEKYDQLVQNRSLCEPAYFRKRPLISNAFWELYRGLVPYRGTVVHSGGIRVHRNGTLDIYKENCPSLKLAQKDQAAYIRAMCFIASHHAARSTIGPYHDVLIESDFSRFEGRHSVQGLRNRHARIEHLVVQVPIERIQAENPLTVRVDFDALRDLMTRISPVQGPNGVLFYTVDIIVNRNEFTSRWHLPIELVPTGRADLVEGDPRFDDCLIHEGSSEE